MTKSAKKSKSVVFRTLHYYTNVTGKHWPLFVLAMATSIGFTVLLTFGSPYIVGLIVDRIGEGAPVDGSQVLEVFASYILVFIGINALGQVCSKLQDYSIWKLEIKASYDLATQAFDTLSNQSMTFHSDRFGGSLVSQTQKFLSAYTVLMECLMYAVVPIILTAVLTIAIMAGLMPVYVVILSAMLIIYIVVSWLLYKRVLPLNSGAAGAQNALSGELSDSITNILAVKTYGREAYERQLFDNANRDVLQADSRRMRSSTFNGSVASLIIVAIMALLVIFITGGTAWFGISAGALVMAFTYTYSLTMQFNRINMTFNQINRGFGDAHDMTIVLDEPTLVADAADAPDLRVEQGTIAFDSVSFSYAEKDEPAVLPTTQHPEPGRGSQQSQTQPPSQPPSPPQPPQPQSLTQDLPLGSATASVTATATAAAPATAHDGLAQNDNMVFSNFNLQIPAGQRVGLVGRSGSGKTTLTSLLLRLSNLQEGQILIDGQDIAAVTQVSLRQQIAYVPQEPLLFHRSVHENIAYGCPDASEQQVREAAIKANALEFIENLQHGFDTITGERGVKLSGGQRQRIAIARAILADKPILVLDEATSALDSESEKLIQDALGNLMQGRTCIVVAHRLSTVASLDRIIVLSEGQIVEDGTHAQLVDAPGEYSRLWNRQTGAFLGDK